MQTHTVWVSVWVRVDAFYSERTASSFLRLTQHELRELLRRKGVEAVDFGKGDKFLGRDILAALELL
jgi:hypothetical protein